MKYSKFLWSVQILTEIFAPSRMCLYSSKAQITTNIFLLWISWLYSTVDNDLLKNTTKCHFLSSLDCWDKTTPVAKFKLSASTLNSAEVFEKARTGVIVIAILMQQKHTISLDPKPKWCCY